MYQNTVNNNKATTQATEMGRHGKQLICCGLVGWLQQQKDKAKELLLEKLAVGEPFVVCVARFSGHEFLGAADISPRGGIQRSFDSYFQLIIRHTGYAAHAKNMRQLCQSEVITTGLELNILNFGCE
jgi:hypothetical protein